MKTALLLTIDNGHGEVILFKVIIPITYFFGRILGKYKKFKDAPRPV